MRQTVDIPLIGPGDVNLTGRINSLHAPTESIRAGKDGKLGDQKQV